MKRSRVDPDRLVVKMNTGESNSASELRIRSALHDEKTARSRVIRVR
jgi:hypothetical protein